MHHTMCSAVKIPHQNILNGVLLVNIWSPACFVPEHRRPGVPVRVVDLEPRAPGRGVVQPIGRGADPTGVAEVGQGLAVGVEEIRWQVVAWVGWGGVGCLSIKEV